MNKLLVILLFCLSLIITTTDLYSSAGSTAEYNVKDFGATGNGTTNDRNAFQNALSAAGNAGGGIVFAPRGRYRIGSSLTIPNHVTLEGVWTHPSRWEDNEGTVLLAIPGHNNEGGTAFIRTNGSNCVIKGLTIYYPNQAKTGDTPIPYPWTIEHVAGDNPSIIDVNIINPYKAVNFNPSGRHFIRNLHGHPFYRGILVNHCLDVGRIENVHFTAEGPYSQGLIDWIRENGVAFTLGRTDWQYMLNTYVSGYKIGYHFSQITGISNGNYLGLAAHYCRYPVYVDEVFRFGALITNGQFTASGCAPDSAAVVVNQSNDGAVSFVNCSFGGDAETIARIRGTGWVSFTDCSFLNWDRENTGQPAIRIEGGRLTVSSSHFQNPGADRKHIELLSGTASAVVMGNQARSPFAVTNHIGNKVRIGFNIGEYDFPPPTTPVVDDGGPFTTNVSSLSASWAADSPQNPSVDSRYAVGMTPGGTDVSDWKSVGTDTSVTLDMSLFYGVTYYFSVVAEGEDGQKSEVGISNGITPVSIAGTISEVMNNPNNTLVGFEGIVTANANSFTRCLFVQDQERFAGIRVWLTAESPNQPVGSMVRAFGLLGEMQGERLIANATAHMMDVSPNPAKPMRMTTSTVGGSDLNPYTPGVTHGIGLYNTGLLVQVFGEVTHVDSDGWVFYLEDGSAVPSPIGTGLGVSYRITTGPLIPPAVGKNVAVTGISGITIRDGIRYPILRLRKQDDLQIID